VSTAPIQPGETGYGFYWRQQVRKAGLAKLRGLPENIGGRALLAVLTAFGEHIGNQTGKGWPSQAKLAEESGQGKRTVERAMKAGQRLGWLVEVAPPVPRIRGTTYLATVPPPVPPGDGNSSPVDGGRPTQLVASDGATRRQDEGDSSPVAPTLVASSDEETRNTNSHIGTLKEERRPLSGASELERQSSGEEQPKLNQEAAPPSGGASGDNAQLSAAVPAAVPAAGQPSSAYSSLSAELRRYLKDVEPTSPWFEDVLNEAIREGRPLTPTQQAWLDIPSFDDE